MPLQMLIAPRLVLLVPKFHSKALSIFWCSRFCLVNGLWRRARFTSSSVDAALDRCDERRLPGKVRKMRDWVRACGCAFATSDPSLSTGVVLPLVLEPVFPELFLLFREFRLRLNLHFPKAIVD